MNKKKVVLPSSYTIIFSVIVLIGILTWCIPGIQHAMPSDVLQAPVEGFKKGVSVILFIFIIGGYLRLINETKALEVGIGKVVQKLNGKEILIIPVIMFICSLGGTTYGFSDEALALYPLVISTLMACGFDVITATATILCGIISGVSGSTINPFSISVAIDSLVQVGITPNQGLVMGMGTIVWLVSYAISCAMVMRYAVKVRKDHSKSYMTAAEKEVTEKAFSNPDILNQTIEFDSKMKTTLAIFGISFAVMIMALIPWADYGITIFEGWSSFLTGTPIGSWYYNELCIWFLIMTVIVGKLNGKTEKQIMRTVVLGAGDLMGAALIVGLSKGVSVLMSSTGFDMYLLNAGTQALNGVPTGLFSTLSYLFYSGFTILIPSTSGLAAASIPTMGGLANSLGFAPELMITIYIAAHHIVGIIPTSGTVMSALSVSKLEYTSWVKFYGKIYLVVSIVNIVLIGIIMGIMK